ncbi:glucose-6-phosphate 1-epimerase [Saccharomycopsis crataegensis]|uniref:Glucose-6-phosphate 1-epimerase n=1 Tax=Saccharomycopsis crataegensis TaxID=43959 RepID=A0AAV5QT80_9ASCO|nr:glucose-6-phosphate 1-epimerase [Saccharomycopsis crataegensis]
MSVKQLEDSVIISLPDNPDTYIKVLRYGAHILSWKINGEEQLWLSAGAKLDGSAAVRGGIPLAFPVFGGSAAEGFNKLPHHGFARISTWDFLGLTSSNPPIAQFALTPDEAEPVSYGKWENGDNNFRAFVNYELGADYLTTSVAIENIDTKPFDFHWLFHTYLRTPDIEDTLVTNLPGEVCYDQVVKEEYEDKAPAVQFHQETDRVYKKVDESKDIQVVYCGKANHTLKRVNLPDVVVWNPWIEKSKNIGDFAPKDDYKHMVCVEPGYASEFVTLKPQGVWKASQTLTYGKDIKIQAV